MIELQRQASLDMGTPEWVSHALYAMHKELIGDNVTKYTRIMVDRIKNASDHLHNGAPLK